MNKLNDLYQEVGAALHKAQLAEYTIVSVCLLLSRTDSEASVKQIEEIYWSKQTLGQLLKPVIDSGLLPEEAKLFLETFRNARNHLAHSFFLSSSEIHTSEGFDMLLREASAMEDIFDKAYQLFDKILSDLACPYGIDLSEIKEQARETVLNSASDSECKT